MANIMVVDDEPGIIDICQRTLTRRGYNVFTAINGEEALKILESQPIELALVDLRMPQYDGNELLKKIKKSYPFTEVVIITAESSLDTAIESLKNGAFDYILKPFNLTELLAAVTRTLEYTNLRRHEIIFSETTSLYQLVAETGKTHTKDELLKLILERASKFLEAGAGTIFSFDIGGSTFRTVASSGYEPHEIKAARLAEFIFRMFSSKHDPVIINGQSKNDDINITEFCPGAVSALIVPFEKHDILLGAMILYRPDESKSAFTLHDLESLQVFSTHASLIIALQHQ
jgi:CheY-like chemotaxis protein